MTAATPLPSGLPAVDRQWGGLVTGHTYLLVGRAGAGRSALALQIVRAVTEAGERCLVISPRAPEALVEVAHGVGLDLAEAHAAGRLRLLRIPPAADLASRGSDGLAAAYRDLVALVASDRPSRVVIEDFTPLVQFDTFERFHDAFSDLVGALRDQDVTLVIGLGDPANEASQRLLDVVETQVDGTIRLGDDGDLVLGVPARVSYPPDTDFPPSDGASVETSVPVPQAAGPAPTEPLSDAAADADGSHEEVDPFAALAVSDPEPSQGIQSASAANESAEGFETTFAVSGMQPEAAEAPTGAAAPPPEARLAPGASGPGGPLETEIVPPPPPDPSLLGAGSDTFPDDPADALFEQGFLVDSGRQPGVIAPPPPVPSTASAPAPPSFASLGTTAPASSRAPEFRSTLDAAFARRTAGGPFLVVALRMDPASPSASHFGALEESLRSALRSGDALWSDASRTRLAVVMPESEPDAGQALFASLQSALRDALGATAEDVLQSVAAVTIVNGDPFESAGDLLAYAVGG